MRILVDLDATVADLPGTLLPLHNEENDDDLTVEKITTWDIQEHCRPGTSDKLLQLFARPGLFASLSPLPGAIKAVEWLYERHNVYIVTAAEHPPGFAEKVWWVREHLPFITKRRLILAHDKHLIRADALIDDKPATICAMREEQPHALTLGIAYPYNVSALHCYTMLAQGWRDTAGAWRKIVETIDCYSTR